MQDFITDIVSQVAPHVQPWHIGAALLVLAAGRWSLWVLRKVVSLRVAAVATGGALMWPQAQQLMERDFDLNSAALLGLGISPTLVWLLAMRRPSSPEQLSPEAQKIMAALNRMTLNNTTVKSDKAGYDIRCGELWCYDDKDWFCRLSNMYIDGVELPKLVPSKVERRKIMQHAEQVGMGLLKQRADQIVCEALAKL